MNKFLDEIDSFDEENQYLLFQSIVKDLVLHSIDRTEYTLLKLIIVFNTRKLSYSVWLSWKSLYFSNR